MSGSAVPAFFRRACQSAIGLLAVCVGLCASVASAQERGFGVGRYDGSTAGSWLFLVDRPWYSDTRWFAAGVTIDGALNPLVPAVASGRGGVSAIVSSALVGHVDLAGSLFDRVLVHASIPVTLMEQGTTEAVSQSGPLTGVALGDPRVGVMVRLLGQAERDRFSLHAGADLWIPTGGQSTNQGDVTARFQPRLVLAGAAGKARWTVDAGFLLRSYASNGPPALGMTAASEARLGLGFGFALADERLYVGPEVQLASQVVGQNAFAVNGMSVEVLGGAQLLVADHLLLGVALGAGFLGAAGTPDARALLRLAWAPRRKTGSTAGPDVQVRRDEHSGGHADVVPVATDDADGDGVPDEPDRCPYEPETRNGIRDADGCPEYGLPVGSPLARVLAPKADLGSTGGAASSATSASGTTGAASATGASPTTTSGASATAGTAGAARPTGAATATTGAATGGTGASATTGAADAASPKTGATGATGATPATGATTGARAAAGASGATSATSGATGDSAATGAASGTAGASATGASRTAAASGASASAAGSTGSTAGPATGAAIVGGASARLPLDADGDGIADDADRCPVQPEDLDGFEDEDGCPELDNDQDGVADAQDKCPVEAETLNGIDDDDGCPDAAPDADKDGIADAADRCPFEPETFDGVRDDDGCPEPQGPSREALALLLVPPRVTEASAPSAANAQAALTYGQGDADHDGILDEADRCPVTKEDADGFEDDDGCPEPDNDADGIADATDKCPVEAETVNGWADDDGCPDEHQDLDGDRVLYENDRCPYEVGDSADGCPHAELPRLALPGFPGADAAAATGGATATSEPAVELASADFDRDGTPDDADACPVSREDPDGFEDEDGCPEPDNDSDGIPDAKDRCPFEAETINGVKDDDGCPDKGAGKVSIQGHEVVIDGVVLFTPGSARLTGSSLPLLKQVASTLKAAKSLTVEIQGHTDDVGSAAKNIRLSKQRAEAIKKVLIKAGVAPNRLLANGYGPTRPRASNKTAQGREQNRRVEFQILGESK